MKKLLLVASLAAPLTAYAGPDFVEGDDTFSGEAELGATLTTGNTDTASVKGRLSLKQELGEWENTYLADALYTEDEGENTAKRYYLGAQGNYLFNEKSYAFVTTNYEEDPFTGYDYKIVGSAGYGYKFINNETVFLSAEIGPGAIYKRLDDNGGTEPYRRERDIVAHGAMHFTYGISDTSKFAQLFVADLGDSLEGRSETSLTANIVGALAMKFSVIVRYNSEPLVDKKSTDTETNVTLLYGF